MIDIFDLRRDFSLKELDVKDVLPDPFEQFELWFQEALQSRVPDANAMLLATVGKDMKPSSRIVLLKQIKNNGFVFFTNYNSKKGKQIAENPYCALTFAWYELERQVRIEGVVEKLLPEASDHYFEKRPIASKLGAWASPQSEIIHDRHYLEELVSGFEEQFSEDYIKRPDNWGGYIVKPLIFEFWQGRESRLHDRLQYSFNNGRWDINRLAP